MPDRKDTEMRLLSGLSPDERAEVAGVARLLAVAPAAATPPSDLEQRTLAAVRAAGAQESGARNGVATQDAPASRRATTPESPPRRGWLSARLRVPRLALAGGLAVALAEGVLAG